MSSMIVRRKGPIFATKAELELHLRSGHDLTVRCLHAPMSFEFTLSKENINTPLDGRPFIYGVYDCWEAVRSWYWQNTRRLLGNYARDYGWWLDPQHPEFDLYTVFTAQEGFAPLTHDAPLRQGDGLLLTLGRGSLCYNHAAVYVGEGRIYHHVLGKPSWVSPLEPFVRMSSAMQKVRPSWL